MEWVEIVLTAIGGSITGLVGSIAYFRPKLREAKANASMAETEASVTSYAHLLERINSMEAMYKQQGEVIDGLRKQVLDLGREKFESDRKVQQLESENADLKKRVDGLAKEIDAYKVLVNNEK